MLPVKSIYTSVVFTSGRTKTFVVVVFNCGNLWLFVSGLHSCFVLLVV